MEENSDSTMRATQENGSRRFFLRMKAVQIFITLTLLTTAQAAPPESATIAAAQAFLQERALYRGPVNGERDEPTVAAIRRYQMLRELPVSGELDAATLHAMLALAPAPAPKETPAVAKPTDRSDAELLKEIPVLPTPAPVAAREPLSPGKPVATPTPSKKAKSRHTRSR